MLLEPIVWIHESDCTGRCMDLYVSSLGALMTSISVSTVRTILMAIYTLLFIACFGNVGLSLYYLSALALDSFQTSAVFSGILVTGLVLLVSSVWGCHRTKDVRSHNRTSTRTAFTSLFLGLFVCFVAWAIYTRKTYDLLACTMAEPLNYWATHLGSESKLLYNFAIEFEEMWIAGECLGNDCVFDDCRGDPVITTPLNCVDHGMQSQFQYLIDSYDGTADELRECVSIVEDIKNKTSDVGLPTVTWCQSRELFLTSASRTNAAMFGLTLAQSICILVSIFLMYYYMFLVRRDFPRIEKRLSWWRARPRLSDSKWLQSMKSEDEGKHAATVHSRSSQDNANV